MFNSELKQEILSSLDRMEDKASELAEAIEIKAILDRDTTRDKMKLRELNSKIQSLREKCNC